MTDNETQSVPAGEYKVETVRRRHIRLGSQLGNRATGMTAFEADVAHQDRATLLSALDAERTARLAAEARVGELERKLAARLEPDMFWDQDNPETPYWDVEELLREREYDRDRDVVIETSEAIRCGDGAYLCRIISVDEDADDDSPTFSIRKLTEDERKEYRNVERIWYAIRNLKPLFVGRALPPSPAREPEYRSDEVFFNPHTPATEPTLSATLAKETP